MAEQWSDRLSNMPTQLYEKSLRSGQHINFDGNVVIMGDVNPGAEITAAGHILVLGYLRGLVHAGSAGEEAATVTALHFAPTQLRIASHITRPPDGGFSEEKKPPEVARIKNDAVVIEPYAPPR